MIIILAERKELSPQEIDMLVKETKWAMKTTVIMRLFGLKPLHSPHARTINKIMEIRNGFVHYKWKPKNDQREKEMEIFLDKIEAAVRYLKNYETRNLGHLTNSEVEKMLDP